MNMTVTRLVYIMPISPPTYVGFLIILTVFLSILLSICLS